MRIKVKQEHIDHGNRNDCETCPIALSLVESGFTCIDVDGIWVSVISPHGWHRVKLPYSVQEWIQEFDDGDMVEPIEFDLELAA